MACSDDVMERLVGYVTKAATAELPSEVLAKTKHHILDTFAAMISGTGIKPGQMAHAFARQQAGGTPEAQVVGTDLILPILPAVTVNGMLGHSDETDDSNGTASLHSGCVMLPAALGMAEREDCSGAELIRAVALGYDIGGRTNKVFGRNAMRARGHLPYGIGGTMGAAAAAGSLAGYTRPEQFRFLFSYAAQQASGVMTYARDTEHVEKAFIFAGMPARNGVTAALMVQLGFTGVLDVFNGLGNFFSTYAEEPDPNQMVAELGSRYEVMLTNIKKYCVGFPIQSALEALFLLRDEHPFELADMNRVRVTMRESGARTVDDGKMPNINLQYMFAVTLLDGAATFAAAHDVDRMNEPAVRDLRSRISVVGDPQLADPKFHSTAIVEVMLRDGNTVTKRVDSFRGKAENPLTTEEVEHKARHLIEPVLNARQAEALIETVGKLEELPKVRDLRPLLSTASRPG